MTTTKKKSTKKLNKKKTTRKAKEDKTSVVVLQCKANKGKTPCLQKAMMAELLCESLSSVVWYHRDDEAQQYEFLVADTGIVPSGRPGGHFEIGITVVRLTQPSYSLDDTKMDLTLHKFLQTFIPARLVSVQDHQA